ncbi:hypothetical protein T484DRAFT_1823096 [Baffinella frigidus]|nr:hypothetical protein T484DRAFT_1823096 [Cryptophyta sp. CCMP2293]
MQKVLLLSALVASVLHVAAGSSCFRSELTFSQEGVCQGATRKLEMCVPPEGLAFYSDPGQLQSMTTQSESFIDKTECDSIATGICAMIGGELSAAPTVSTCGFNCGMAMGCDDAACAAATTDEARSSAVQCCDHADIAALLKTVADGACVGGSGLA